MFGLARFYGISNIVDYLMPSHIFRYITSEHIFDNIFKRIWAHFFGAQINGLTYFYVMQIILLTFYNLIARSKMFSSSSIQH